MTLRRFPFILSVLLAVMMPLMPLRALAQGTTDAPPAQRERDPRVELEHQIDRLMGGIVPLNPADLITRLEAAMDTLIRAERTDAALTPFIDKQLSRLEFYAYTVIGERHHDFHIDGLAVWIMRLASQRLCNVRYEKFAVDGTLERILRGGGEGGFIAWMLLTATAENKGSPFREAAINVLERCLEENGPLNELVPFALKVSDLSQAVYFLWSHVYSSTTIVIDGSENENAAKLAAGFASLSKDYGLYMYQRGETDADLLMVRNFGELLHGFLILSNAQVTSKNPTVAREAREALARIVLRFTEIILSPTYSPYFGAFLEELGLSGSEAILLLQACARKLHPDSVGYKIALTLIRTLSEGYFIDQEDLVLRGAALEKLTAELSRRSLQTWFDTDGAHPNLGTEKLSVHIAASAEAASNLAVVRAAIQEAQRSLTMAVAPALRESATNFRIVSRFSLQLRH